MAWPPLVPPATRANNTPQLDNHPGDHNGLANAITDVVARLAAAAVSQVAGAVAGATVASGQTATVCTFTIPAGPVVRMVAFSWSAQNTASPDPVAVIALNGPGGVIYTQRAYPVTNGTALRFNGRTSVPAAGGTYWITIGNTGSGSFSVFADGANHQGTALITP